MRIDQIPELGIEEVQKLHKEYPKSVETLIGRINEILNNFNLIFNKRISLVDNVECTVRINTIKGGAEIRLGRSGTALPRQIVVGRVKTSGAVPTTAVQILDWSIAQREIIISTSNIVGLTLDQSYDLTLTIYY